MKILDGSGSRYTYYALCPIGHWAATVHTDLAIGAVMQRCPHCGIGAVLRQISKKTLIRRMGNA